MREKGEWDKGGSVSKTMTDVKMTNMIETIGGQKIQNTLSHVTLHDSEMFLWKHGCAYIKKVGFFLNKPIGS